MEELHAAIAAHPRAQRRHLTAAGERESAILALWYERAGVPRCRYCGKPITDDEGGLYNLADMRQVRECASHYTPYS